MKRNDGCAGFWEPGFDIFGKELTQEEASRLEPLEAAFKAATDSSKRDELTREMAAIKAEFKAKRQSARYSLFAKK